MLLHIYEYFASFAINSPFCQHKLCKTETQPTNFKDFVVIFKAFDLKCKLWVQQNGHTPLIGNISGIISPSLNIHTKLHVALQNDINDDDMEYCRA